MCYVTKVVYNMLYNTSQPSRCLLPPIEIARLDAELEEARRERKERLKSSIYLSISLHPFLPSSVPH